MFIFVVLYSIAMSIILNPILLFHFFEIINYVGYVFYLPRYYPPVIVYFFEGI